MPADSDPERRQLPPLPRTYRPLGPRIAGVVMSVVLVVTFAALWVSFSDDTKQQVNFLQRATVVLFILVGVALLLGLARSRVTATDSGLTVVNAYRNRRYEWAEVIAVRMPPGAPWPTLDLADGTTVSAFGIQASDGERAKDAVAQVKGYLAWFSRP